LTSCYKPLARGASTPLGNARPGMAMSGTNFRKASQTLNMSLWCCINIQQEYLKLFVDMYNQALREKQALGESAEKRPKRGLSRTRRYRLLSAAAQHILVCYVLAGVSDPVKPDPCFLWHDAVERASVASCDEGDRHPGQRGEPPACASCWLQ
jgi:hypothetical protein